MKGIVSIAGTYFYNQMTQETFVDVYEPYPVYDLGEDGQWELESILINFEEGGFKKKRPHGSWCSCLAGMDKRRKSQLGFRFVLSSNGEDIKCHTIEVWPTHPEPGDMAEEMNHLIERLKDEFGDDETVALPRFGVCK